MKKLLVLIIAIVSTNVNAGILPDLFAGRQANESVIENVKRSEFGVDTDRALEALITHVAFVLARTGHKGESRAIVKEFNENYRGYFARISMKGLGDHEPLSRWLADLYDRVEARVGKDIMHYARLDDILGMEEFVAPEMSPLIYRVANENCQ